MWRNEAKTDIESILLMTVEGTRRTYKRLSLKRIMRGLKMFIS